jgi:signal transduction histidine kinase
MRIRKKLIFLHTCFFLILAAILGLAIRPAIRDVVRRAELHEARLVLLSALQGESGAAWADSPDSITVARSDAAALGISESLGAAARAAPGKPAPDETAGASRLVAFDGASGQYIAVSVRLADARDAVLRLYLLMTVALLAVYVLVAVALEVLVLPEHVYGPIRRILAADRALQQGRREEELVPESAMPADELGEIMRSRNDSVATMRRQEHELGAALRQLEASAADLQRKNHLLEMARRNLADADRLASLGIMSAGLAHELNTPLSVLKGLAEKLARSAPGDRRAPAISASEAELMLRVIGRLERLSDSLLDFARVRPPSVRRAELWTLVEEAWTLVALDRAAPGIAFLDQVPAGMSVECDPDRIVQVLVNLLRNAVDALDAGAGAGRFAANGGRPTIEVVASSVERDGREWVSLTISDNGPGIDPEVLARMFEPFVSTRLDARGTGLGLAVSEGIIKEHGGLLLARNRDDAAGAVFEIVLPVQAGRPGADAPHTVTPPTAVV